MELLKDTIETYGLLDSFTAGYRAAQRYTKNSTNKIDLIYGTLLLKHTVSDKLSSFEDNLIKSWVVVPDTWSPVKDGKNIGFTSFLCAASLGNFVASILMDLKNPGKTDIIYNVFDFYSSNDKVNENSNLKADLRDRLRLARWNF